MLIGSAMFGATSNLLHVLDYRNFWNTKRWYSRNQYFRIKQMFQLQKRLPKWGQHFVKNGYKIPGFCQKAQNFV